MPEQINNVRSIDLIRKPDGCYLLAGGANGETYTYGPYSEDEARERFKKCIAFADSVGATIIGAIMTDKDTEIKPRQRDPSVPCPDCGQAWLFSDCLDICWNCGRHVEGQNATPKG